MKKAFVQPKIGAAFGAVCLAVVAGTWAVRHEQTGAPAARASMVAAPVDLLAALPKPTGNSASDREVAGAIEKARSSPNDDKAWVRLGDALMQTVRESGDQKGYGNAESAYGKALSINPKNSEAMTGLAWVHGGRHEFDKSVDWAKRAIALDARNNVAYGVLGDADVEMGDYEAALDHYQKMLDIRPDLASYSRGAHLLYLTGDVRKGIWLMAKAIRAGAPYAENTAWCRAQLAQMLLGWGAVLPAEQIAADALKHTPNNRHVLAAMGRIKTARKDYPAAIALYKKALAVAPDHNALVALGDLYGLIGDKPAAEKQYALVEEFHRKIHAGGVPHSDMQLAQFYADHDRSLVEAMRMAEGRKTSNNVFEADTLAWCYYKNNQYAAAKSAIARALRWHTPDAKILFHAGMIYAKLGERGTAQRYLNQALSLNPNFSPLDSPVAARTLRSLAQVARADVK